ncbi:MAG: hypothetical protein IT158_12845 [Bryobacterales bacterium]|nr:hypothetical protein [Bryobacterales bacterium]
MNIDGRFSGDCLRLVEACCAAALSSRKRVRLVLRDVRAIDAEGQDLLCRLAGKGVRLQASGVYLSHLVGKLQRATGSTGPAGGGRQA